MKPPMSLPLGRKDHERLEEFFRQYPHGVRLPDPQAVDSREIHDWFDRYPDVDYEWFGYTQFRFRDPKMAAIFKLQFG